MKKTTTKRIIIPVNLDPDDVKLKHFTAMKHFLQLEEELADLRKEANDVTPNKLMQDPGYYKEVSDTILKAYEIKKMLTSIIQPFNN